jgi:uncharacterized protein YicC (UPF0701 family)
MKKYYSILLTFALVGHAPVFAQSAGVTDLAVAGPGARGMGHQVEIQAKVVVLDAVRRTVSLQGPKGRVVTVNVPADVRNFDQVQVGDMLSARYTAAVATRLERVAKSGIRERVETVGAVRTQQGDKLGVELGRSVEILAEIQRIDRKHNEVVLRGAERTVTLVVSPSVDLKTFKVGDEVRALFIEAALITVDKAAN